MGDFFVISSLDVDDGGSWFNPTLESIVSRSKILVYAYCRVTFSYYKYDQIFREKGWPLKQIIIIFRIASYYKYGNIF